VTINRIVLRAIMLSVARFFIVTLSEVAPIFLNVKSALTDSNLAATFPHPVLISRPRSNSGQRGRQCRDKRCSTQSFVVSEK
jgi:hypothetical protein